MNSILIILSIFLKIIAAMLLGIVALLVVLYATGRSPQRFAGADPKLSCWMSRIPDGTPLNRVAIPGSHDAGTAGVLWAGETQTATVAQQLLCGSRYFDLRVHKKGDRYVIFHSIVDGMEFQTVLSSLKEFIQAHPSEVLLLDFQHFKGESQPGVRELLEKELKSAGLLVENKTGLSQLDFVRQLTLGDVRGKCMVFWGDKSEAAAPYLFPRNTDTCTEENMCLDSYYISSCHKKDTAYLLDTGHPAYLQRMEDLTKAGKNGIFVLQCQLTDGMVVRGPWKRERSHDAAVSAYIRGLASGEHLKGINVIMRDFIRPDKCEEIINLNAAKGYLEKPL